jgi:hypothetical protein
VQYYHKETYTWNKEEEWRVTERQRRVRESDEDGELQSVKNGGKKRAMVC